MAARVSGGVNWRRGVQIAPLILLSACVALRANPPSDEGWMGANLRERASSRNHEKGVEVGTIAPSGPARRAGLLPGDIIQSVEGRTFGSAKDFVGYIRSLAPGTSLVLRILRQGRPITLELVLGKLPPEIALYRRGLAFAQDGAYDRAISEYSAALRIDPSYTAAYISRGQAAQAKGLNDQAVADCTTALGQDPGNASAHNIRGLAFLRSGRPDEAIADFSSAIRIDASYEAPYNNRGNAYLEKGNVDLAIADYGRAIEITKDNPSAFRNRANAYVRKGDKSRADSDYITAARQYQNRGLDLSRKGRYEAAIEQYTAAILLKTRYTPPIIYNRGLSYEKNGLYVQAVADYTEAFRFNPRFAAALLRRGLVYATKLNDPDKAKADWKEAARIDPGGKAGRAAFDNLRKLEGRHGP